jgi:hypothetical protein
MFDDLTCPFMVDGIKVWPCASRPGFQHFIAHGGRPFYFRSKAEAVLFVSICKRNSSDATTYGNILDVFFATCRIRWKIS